MTWTRHRTDQRCISCLSVIPAGDPIRLVTIADRPWCEACAGRHLEERPPADLEPLAPLAPAPASPFATAQPFEAIGQVATRRRAAIPGVLRFDAKAAAAGERGHE